MLFSCLLLPRVPINNPSRSETARLLLRGENWVLAVIFLPQLKGPFPFLPAAHLVGACSSPGPLSGEAVSLLTWAPVCGEPPRRAGLLPGSRGSWVRAWVPVLRLLYRCVAEATEVPSSDATLVSVPASLSQMPTMNEA